MKKSWVWMHCDKAADGKSATCLICDSVLQTHGSTSTLIEHLENIHSINRPSAETTKRPHDDSIKLVHQESNISQTTDISTDTEYSHLEECSEEDNAVLPIPIKRARMSSTRSKKSGSISKERVERITQAVTKLVAYSRLPYNFVSSSPFKDFMKELEPNYNCPCSQTIVRRLRRLEDKIKIKMQSMFAGVQYVAVDTDCWNSRSQEGYMSVNAHIIDNDWVPHIFNLCTEELEERHNAENLADRLYNVMVQFEINEKIVAIANDNASNIVKAVQMMPNVPNDVTCAAHKLHLAVQHALQEREVSNIFNKGTKIVSHFRHSVVASKSLEQKQEQLGLPKLKLVQSVCTRWNTDLQMAERLIENRNAIMNVLADRSVTSQKQAQTPEIFESEWNALEALVEVLKPLEVATTVLSGGTLSMVNPIIRSLIDNHLSTASNKYEKERNENIFSVIDNLSIQLSDRFFSEKYSDLIHLAGKASFFDPRFKMLQSETSVAKIKIKIDIEKELQAVKIKTAQIDEIVQKKASAMDFLFKRAESQLSPAAQQYKTYLAQPELDMNLDPFEWWKSHENRFPLIGLLAKKYLSIPATSVASERTFSTAGNIVTPKRSCLCTENVATNVFVFQNRKYV